MTTLIDMNCLVESYSSIGMGTYSSFISDFSGVWLGYIFGGLGAFSNQFFTCSCYNDSQSHTNPQL